MARRLRVEACRPTIDVRQTYDQRVTGSAIRALDVLSFFDDVRRPATVGEIAEALGIPQSSTSLLLRSLVAAGYLDHDAYERTFITAERTALLGHWIDPRLIRESTLVELMRKLHDQTAATVFLASRNGLNAQYIFVLQSDSENLSHLVPGTVRPLVASSAGYALMADWSDQRIVSTAMRYNAEHGEHCSSPRDVIEAVEHVRHHGYAISTNLHTRGGLAIAAPIRRFAGDNLLALCVGSVGDTSQQRVIDFGTHLKDAISELQ